MYRFKFPDNPDILLDGRAVIFVAKEIGKPRERVSLLLNCSAICDYEYASKIVHRCKPSDDVLQYFEKTSIDRGTREWEAI